MVDQKVEQDNLGYSGGAVTVNRKTWTSRKTPTRLTSWLAAGLISFGLFYTTHNHFTPRERTYPSNFISGSDQDLSRYPLPPNENSTSCPQPSPLSTTSHAELERELFALYAKEDYRLRAFEALGGAIRVPYVLSPSQKATWKKTATEPLTPHRTESYDDLLPVGQDSRWDIFAELHEYLETSFPLV